MRHLTAKQIQRIEKKKKKVAAFLEIAKLNDDDRAKAATQDDQKAHEPMDLEDCQSELTSPNGPCRKRHKNNYDFQHGDSNVENGDTLVCEQKNLEEKPMDVVESNEFLDSTRNSYPELEDKKCVSNLEPHSTKSKKKKMCESYAELKNELRERRNRSKVVPSFRLKTVGELASINMKEESRTPLLLTDIQQILMYALLGQQAPMWPLRWCVLEKYSRLSHIVVLLIEGVSLNDFINHSSSFCFINGSFENKLEVIMPPSYNGSLVEELISVPVTEICKKRLIQQYGSLDAAAKANGDVYKTLRAFFPFKSSEGEKDPSLPSSDTFSRTKLLLSPSQLIEEKYPVPVKGELQERGCEYTMSYRYSDFLLTKDFYKDATPVSPMFGLDCEMCRTTSGYLEVTRISVVNEKLEVVYESLVKPYNRITDYLTQFSGITKQTLSDVTVRLEDVQRELRNLLPNDAILVGQSLNADLQALKMMHPFVIDTSVIYNMTGERNRKSKLSMLSHKFLRENIQKSNKGHCSVEDSRACIKLVQLKLANGIEYGDAVLLGRRDAEIKRERSSVNAQLQLNEDLASSIFSHAQRFQKDAAVVTLPERIRDYNNCISNADDNPGDSINNVKSRLKCLEEFSNEAVVEQTCQIILEHHFTLSHIFYPPKVEPSPFSMAALDNMCQTLWQHMALNGIFMVLLGGKGSANGACFATIKKKEHLPGSKL